MAPQQDRQGIDDAGGAGHVLDNVVWHALGGEHADVAMAHGAARRYHVDVSVFGALADASDQSWTDLATLLGPRGGALLTAPWFDVPPPGWTRDYVGGAHQMVLPGDVVLPDDEPAGLRPLDTDDVPAMTALVEVAQPGPFRPRTVELGGYVGVFDGGELVAMAGRRLHVDGYIEISAVATHPAWQGRGLGAAITASVARAIRAEGRTPFLHVAEDNVGARRVYERLGFVTRTMSTFLATRPPR